MKTLILSPRMPADAFKLEQAALAQNWRVCRLERWRLSGEENFGDEIAIYGEPLFARIIAAQLQLSLLEPSHDWLAQLPHACTQRQIRYTSLAAIEQLDYPAFIKPPDDKLFTARVYQNEGQDASDLMALARKEPEQAILVSEPVQFHREYRCHVLDARVVSCSRYLLDGELAESEDDPFIKQATSFAESLCRIGDAPLPPAVVVDVGILDNGNWAVVEANPCFGAGIYHGNSSRILEVLLAACMPSAALPAELEDFCYPVILEE